MTLINEKLDKHVQLKGSYNFSKLRNMVKPVYTNTVWCFARNTNSLFTRSVNGKPAKSEQGESLLLCAILVLMIQLASSFAIWFWNRTWTKEEWKNWKNLWEDAVRLQEDAVNQRDLAVVLELTYDMVSSATK